MWAGAFPCFGGGVNAKEGEGGACSCGWGVCVLRGVPVAAMRFGQALECLGRMLCEARFHHVVTANTDFLFHARCDPAFADLLRRADLVLCDGAPLVWLSRLRSVPIPERVAGADLVPFLLERARSRGLRVFWLGGCPEAARAAADAIGRSHPGLDFQWYAPEVGEVDGAAAMEVVERVRKVAPALLLVSLGAPKAERWIAAPGPGLGVRVAVGVGAAIDFTGGRRKRAPRWMRCVGAEWLFRLLQEPLRLGRRYLRDLLLVVPWVLGEAIGGGAQRSAGGGDADQTPGRVV